MFGRQRIIFSGTQNANNLRPFTHLSADQHQFHELCLNKQVLDLNVNKSIQTWFI